MVKFFKINYLYFFLVPLILNFLVNLYENNVSFKNFQIYDLSSSILIFLFLYSVGYCLKLIFKNMTVTFGIISYLFSFFILESLALFFYSNINLHNIFWITNLIWIAFYLVAKGDKKLLMMPIALYLFMIYLNNYFIDSMSINLNIEGDVKDVFFTNTLSIYETSYKESILNSPLPGYPQFMSYIDALIFKISFGLQEYSYIASTSLVFFWLNLLLFSESINNKKIRIFIIALFTLLIINSVWLQFLFTSSLMSERMAGYFLAGILFTLFNTRNKSFHEISIIFFVLSFLYVTKQFFSIMVPILFVIFLFTKSFRKGSAFLLSSLLLKEISYSTYFSGVPKDLHIRQIDIIDTIEDFFLLRDLQFENIFIIFQNLIIDIPMTYFLILVLCICLYLYKKNKSSFELNLYVFLSVANLLLILGLYISVWRGMELESPIRYIYSFLAIYFLLFSKSLERLLEP